MIKIKNIGKRLITFEHGSKRYPVKCGLDNEAIVPDEVVEQAFFKALVKTNEVVECGSADVEAEPEDERYEELKAMKVGDLRDMAKDMYEITNTSRMKEDELIKAIIEAEAE